MKSIKYLLAFVVAPEVEPNNAVLITQNAAFLLTVRNQSRRDYNIEVAKFDRRTPGLFKDEWSGDAMVSLSSKNYMCYLPDESYKVKVSAKGVQQGRALYQKAKELDFKITHKIVKDWYASQTDIQRFQEQKKRFDGFKIASHNPNSWQMDLTFWKKRPIFSAININSRLGYANLLSDKTAPAVLAALKAFVHLHKVDILTRDNGGEFMNSQAQAFYKSKKIEHYNNDPGDHGTMGRTERFNRTLKQKLTKMSPKRITQKLIADVIETTIARFIAQLV
ncbi:unnamed protein product [Phytophthora lilii]|uniref:Unnamed protein product n=1 Tax=Phytophthora lilii TaxID=2077276 RepID=A0A9W6XQX8_9STRA|nr:unnamed protein product [Phytophthora lilii]